MTGPVRSRYFLRLRYQNVNPTPVNPLAISMIVPGSGVATTAAGDAANARGARAANPKTKKEVFTVASD
jgi:hypothetical protein